MRVADPVDRTRRRALRALLRACSILSAPLFGGGSACRRAPTTRPPGTVDIPVRDVPPGGRVVVQYDGEPVEVLRLESGVIARNLSCTHFGCPVTWREGTRSYHCACHDGRFDEEGQPVAGPPLLPLRRVPAALLGDTIRVGAP